MIPIIAEIQRESLAFSGEDQSEIPTGTAELHRALRGLDRRRKTQEQVSSMPSYNAGEFKKGLKVQIEGDPYVMIEMDFMKPGKGQAVYRAKLKNLLTGRIIDRSYRSGETLEAADVEERTVNYLYQDGTYFHFMDPNSFEQYELTTDQIGDMAKWFVEEMQCDVVFWDGRPISVTPPPHVELKVTYTEPGAKGNSTGNVQKPATLHTGAEISVPTFINVDDIVRIDTRTGEYVERVTKS